MVGPATAMVSEACSSTSQAIMRSRGRQRAHDLEEQPDDAIGRVGHRQAPGALAHRGEGRAVRQEAPHGLHEPARRERDLREDHGASRGLHEARVGRLLVSAGPGQRDVEGGQAELAALVDGARAAAPDDERGRRVDVAQLGPDVRASSA